MTNADRELGMDRAITRRDFLNGVSVAIGGAMAAGTPLEAAQRAPQPAAAPADPNYPPALTGMRGSEPGTMDVAHAMRDGKQWDTGQDTGESYDLIVVGGGLS